MDDLCIECLKFEEVESGSMHGQFLIKPLQSGQGITVGNILRRVLLNDLGGTAITGIRIPNIKDEFSIISGVREDILEILLNLKGIVVKTNKISTSFGRLKIKGPAVITGNSIELPSDMKLVNPNHYIATISDSNVVEIEFKFEYGVGYRLAREAISDDSEDFLEIDAVFLPVQKVDFKIEKVYAENNQITERLFLDVWTNGSIVPEEAISLASKFIMGVFNSIVNNKFVEEINEVENNSNNLPSVNPHVNIAIEELQLSVRPYNCLKRANIHTIGDLLEYSPEELQELKNFGKKSANEVFSTLKNKLGIILC